MIRDFFNRFFKEQYQDVPSDEVQISNENYDFTLKIEELEIGYLKYEKGLWAFRYSEDFKSQETYSRIVGFSDLGKAYESEILWPFFKLRIPGLKQPMVQEILAEENIDKTNDAFLLKRFGRRNISNPYILETI
jgi:hypothetical protein